MISDSEVLKQLIEQVADFSSKLAEFIEKDYYSILLLKQIVCNDIEANKTVIKIDNAYIH